MSASSARQLDVPEFGLSDAVSGASPQSAVVGGNQSSAGATITAFMPLSAPNADASAYAVASRILARLNTSVVKPVELRTLLEERRKLLDKKLDGTMTRQDENRLEYVRWSLGRIQDARSGPALDALQEIAGVYQRFSSDMSDFLVQLNGAASRKERQHR
jgi:hypothetical protein